mgnify:FL=1
MNTVYTRIRHSPVLGVYKSLTETKSIYKVIVQVGFILIGKIRKQKAEPTRVGRPEADPRKVEVD